MNEEERQKLIERRARRQKEKELENDLQRDLKPKERKQLRDEKENKFQKGAVIFLGTLAPLYLLIFGSFFLFVIFFSPWLIILGLDPMWFPPFFHMGIWIASIISVYKEKSVFDMWLERYG